MDGFKHSTVLWLLVAFGIMKLPAWARGDERAEASIERSFTVSGLAEMEVQPDEARIDFDFSTKSRKLKNAHEETMKKVKAFGSQLVSLGISEKQIELGNVSYHPNYTYPKNAPAKLDSFSASIQVSTRISDFSKIPSIIDAAVNNELNWAGNIQFYSTKLPEHKKKLRDLGIRAVREKADQLAKGLGIKVGAIKTIDELSGNQPSRARHYGYEPVPQAMANLSVQRDTDDNQPPETSLGPITPGSIKLSLTLYVTYFIE